MQKRHLSKEDWHSDDFYFGEGTPSFRTILAEMCYLYRRTRRSWDTIFRHGSFSWQSETNRGLGLFSTSYFSFLKVSILRFFFLYSGKFSLTLTGGRTAGRPKKKKKKQGLSPRFFSDCHGLQPCQNRHLDPQKPWRKNKFPEGCVMFRKFSPHCSTAVVLWQAFLSTAS